MSGGRIAPHSAPPTLTLETNARVGIFTRIRSQGRAPPGSTDAIGDPRRRTHQSCGEDGALRQPPYCANRDATSAGEGIASISSARSSAR